jgi:hypothetical protein
MRKKKEKRENWTISPSPLLHKPNNKKPQTTQGNALALPLVTRRTRYTESPLSEMNGKKTVT